MANRDETRRARWSVVLLSLTLFIAACVTPALELRNVLASARPGDTGQPNEVAFGIRLLMAGWLVLGLPILAWLANVTLLLGWFAVAMRWWRSAIFLALLSFVFAADLFRIVPEGTPPLGPINPRYYFIERPLIGCYLWLASMAVVGVGAGICWRRQWRAAKQPVAGSQAQDAGRRIGYDEGQAV
jgi:hypothetical protein